MSGISKLTKLIPPPKSPVDTGTRQEWEKICKSTGLELPDDYFELCTAYGSGEFLNGAVRMLNPFAKSYTKDLKSNLDRLGRSNAAGVIPGDYEIFPEKPGLFPSGKDDNGRRLCWLTKGPPKKWPTIIVAADGGPPEKWDLNLTELMYRVFSGELKCLFTQSGIEPEEVVFTPDKKKR